jgi:hypothetical protein
MAGKAPKSELRGRRNIFTYETCCNFRYEKMKAAGISGLLGAGAEIAAAHIENRGIHVDKGFRGRGNREHPAD